MKVLVAAFDSERALRAAITAAKQAKIAIQNVYSPYELDVDVAESKLAHSAAALTRDCALGALLVFGAVFALEAWSKLWAFPLHVGGREALAWPALVLPAIEAAMLAGGVGGLVSFFVRAQMPALADPIFETPEFSTATSHRFYLVAPASQQGEDLLRHEGAIAVHGIDA